MIDATWRSLMLGEKRKPPAIAAIQFPPFSTFCKESASDTMQIEPHRRFPPGFNS
jgi:hypothetical protein